MVARAFPRGRAKPRFPCCAQCWESPEVSANQKVSQATNGEQNCHRRFDNYVCVSTISRRLPSNPGKKSAVRAVVFSAAECGDVWPTFNFDAGVALVTFPREHCGMVPFAQHGELSGRTNQTTNGGVVADQGDGTIFVVDEDGVAMHECRSCGCDHHRESQCHRAVALGRFGAASLCVGFIGQILVESPYTEERGTSFGRIHFVPLPKVLPTPPREVRDFFFAKSDQGTRDGGRR